MRNTNRAEKILTLVEKMPYFSLVNLRFVEKNKKYLKIILSRYENNGKLLRLKKGLYVSTKYLDSLEKRNLLNDYTEFAAGIIYPSSYLSLDYILYEYNILSELPKNFTSITLKKTANFSNNLGNYFYHKIKPKLFAGFKTEEKNNLIIFKASRAKALFDFLYLRKNVIINLEAFEGLRLNLGNLTKSDLREFKKYLKIEGSKKMYAIANYLFKKFDS